MTDDIQLSSENENKQVSEVVINAESSLSELGGAKLIKDRSVHSRLIWRARSLLWLFTHTDYLQHWITASIAIAADKRRGGWRMSGQNSEGTWSRQSLALLIAVMGIFAAGAYVVLFSFHEAFPISAPFKSVNLSTWELLTFPSAATEDFLVITTVTTTFILSMGMNTITVCFIFRKFAWGTFFTILSLFAIAAFSLSFFAMLSKFVPHSITIAGGNLKVPATFIVIFYDIYVIILVCALACTAQCLLSFWRKKDADVKRTIVV